jgi:hypothetical protein
MDTKKVVYLLTENCKSRLSCSGCDMTGKHSLKDTCLLLLLKDSLKQPQLTLETLRLEDERAALEKQSPFEKQVSELPPHLQEIAIRKMLVDCGFR